LHANAFYKVLCGHEKHETDEHEKRSWGKKKKKLQKTRVAIMKQKTQKTGTS